LNNNNNRNNRRRGRGNRNQGSGNGSQLNRIDSRARGNAPQMLDKYKKLAQDAHHNGDRVQMEYYLQFADHYFRVIADNKARVDESRGTRRPDDRDQAEEYGDDDLDFGRRSEPSSRSRYEPQDNDSRGDMAEGEAGQEGESFLSDDRDDGRDDGRNNGRDDDRSDRQPRQANARRQPRKPRDDNRAERPERAERNDGPRAERPERAERAERSDAPRAERPERSEKRADKPAEKPALRARKPRKPADDDRAVIDSSILPPSIRGDDSSGDSDGTLEAVG
jgi:Domain of unknown function (DUF4167)